MHRASLATFTMLAAVALISGARAGSPPQYTARFITPGIDAINASAMNSAGDVVGTGTTGSGAWVSRAGAPAVLLPLPSGAQYAVANDINEAGVIVGSVSSGSYPWMGRAAAWFPDSAGGYTITEFGTLPGHVSSSAAALNNVGDIIGSSSNGTFSYPVLFTPSGIQDLSATGIFNPADINDQRVLIDRSFICKRLDLDTMVVEELGVPVGPPTYLASSGEAINQSGQVAGLGIYACCPNCDRVAARYTDGVGWEVFSGCGQSNGAYDINNHGDVVMRLNVAPYVRFEDLGAFRIEDLIINDVGHWYVINGYGLTINNSRQMVVPAVNNETDEGGLILLTPVATIGDINGDGSVNIDDLLAVIAAWGPCPASPAACVADVVVDGQVNIDDLLLVISSWGP
jgi:uncharacterized membrane protein